MRIIGPKWFDISILTATVMQMVTSAHESMSLLLHMLLHLGFRRCALGPAFKEATHFQEDGNQKLVCGCVYLHTCV